jgi:hypothetical protein
MENKIEQSNKTSPIFLRQKHPDNDLNTKYQEALPQKLKYHDCDNDLDSFEFFLKSRRSSNKLENWFHKKRNKENDLEAKKAFQKAKFLYYYQRENNVNLK